MRIITELCRFLVGGLFIFSGIIKLIDPVGMQIKLEEYFQVFSEDIFSGFSVFAPFALSIGLILCVAEVVLGVALLLYYRMKLTTVLLIALIVFFTFLTFYSAAFNKVTDCGCFGDFIKLKPWESFLKDIVLLVLLLPLYFMRRFLDPILSETRSLVVIGLSAVGSFYLAGHALAHLPPVDFRAYAVGQNIIERRNLPPDEYMPLYQMLNKKTGQLEEKTADEYMAIWEDTLTWEYKGDAGRRLIREGHPKRIPDFFVFNESAEDRTEEILAGPWLFAVFNKPEKLEAEEHTKIRTLLREVEKLGHIKVASLTSTTASEFETFRHESQLPFPFYTADTKVVKTIMRSAAGFWLIENGVVKGKWHINDTPLAMEVDKLVKLSPEDLKKAQEQAESEVENTPATTDSTVR